MKSISWTGGVGLAQQVLILSCSHQSQGMHLVKRKDAEKLAGVQINNNPRGTENALQWETYRASPLYLITKKNERDLITAHEYLLRQKTPGTAKPL